MSSKQRKQHKQQQKHPPRGKHAPVERSHKKKERGGLLTAAIIYMVLHSLLALGGIYGNNLLLGGEQLPNWFILSAVGAVIADIVAAAALWQWKKWGLTLYLVATAVAIVLGILATGSGMLWSFSRLIPFVIVGYIVRSRWQYFE